MLIITTSAPPDREVLGLHGLVSGSVVQSKNLFRDIGAGFKSMIGGELKSYTKLMDTARADAITKMIAEATHFGANAILGVRMTAGQITPGAAEIYVYGTAATVSEQHGTNPG